MLSIYIAGPMSGYPDHNFPAFHEAAYHWREAGWDVINPAELDAPDITVPRLWRYFLRQDLKLLVDCDAIAFLPGWQGSKGAELENAVATALGIRVFDANHVVDYAKHTFMERNVCCQLVDYMHEDGWWTK